MIKTTKYNDYMRFLRKFFELVMPRYGFTPRENQIELAEEIFTAMNERNVFLAEAAVGAGKTLAYLLPSVITRRSRLNESKLYARLPDGHAMPILIATSSIALQKSLITDYIPALSKILIEHGIIKKPLTAAIRKGKSHYLCERRLNNFIRTADDQALAALTMIRNHEIVDLTSLKGITKYIKNNINVNVQCSPDCPLSKNCRYIRYIRSVNKGGYDFQVVNHNLLLADISHRAQEKRPLIPEAQAVIIDEAHKFLDAAKDMYGTELSLTDFYNVIKDINAFTLAPRQQSYNVGRWADRVSSKSRLFFQLLNQEVPDYERNDTEKERYSTKIRGRADKLLRALYKDINVLAELLPKIVVTHKFKERHKSAIRTLSHISKALAVFVRHKELVYWLEETDFTPVLKLSNNKSSKLNILRGMPKNLGTLLYKDLWSKKIPIILISGTLSAAGSFEHIKKKSGLNFVPAERLVQTTKPSLFDYKRNVILYISENIPFPKNTNKDYIDTVTAEVEKLIAAANGHTAILFTSYKAMEMVHERITALDLPYPIFRLERGGTAALEQYKQSVNGVLFGTGALWEGVDIPGDVLSMLIIVRLPFAVPDPLSEWEKTLYADINEYKEKVVVPEMLIKLKQGFGRLMRLETDTGVVAILDCRTGKKGAYRNAVLETFPKCQVTSDIKEVSRFIKTKKPSDYFK